MKAKNICALIAGGAVGILIAQSITRITPQQLIKLEPIIPYISGGVMLIGLLIATMKYLLIEEERNTKKFVTWLIITNIIVVFIVGGFKLLKDLYL